MVSGMFIGDVIKLVYQQTVDLLIFTSQLVVDLNFGLDLWQHLETYNLLVFGVACTAPHGINWAQPFSGTKKGSISR